MFTIKNIRLASTNRAKDYVIDNPELKEAVNLSIWLQKPLLLTGAPGTGKTQLAYKVAWELSQIGAAAPGNGQGFAPFIEEPFVFHTKTTSTASDLFYFYDAVKHFQRRPIQHEGIIEDVTPHPFIELNALGKAILQSFGRRKIDELPKLKELAKLNKFEDEIAEEPRSSVVLIDEIDKAPRDFPNDLLNEIDQYEFRIQELNKTIRKDREQKPFPVIVVIMTSNFEKNLPDAFLRRCLFYHIPPANNEELYKIVSSRMQPYLEELHAGNGMKDTDIKSKLKEFNKAADEFLKFKENLKDKKPATAEFLEWIRVLELKGFFSGDTDFSKLTEDQKTILRFTLPILAKSKDDIGILRSTLSL